MGLGMVMYWQYFFRTNPYTLSPSFYARVVLVIRRGDRVLISQTVTITEMLILDIENGYLFDTWQVFSHRN
jgi:hypothetical protein